MITRPYPKEAESVEIAMPQPYTIESEAKLIVYHAVKSGNGAVLEIGASSGFLTKAIALNVYPRTVYALDWAYNINISLHQDAEKPSIVAERALHLNNVIAINGDSKRFDYPPGLSMIFIDGDHTWEGVTADTEKAMRYREQYPNVTIVWHDYRPEAQWMGVARLLDKMAMDAVPLFQYEGTPVVVLEP